MSKNRLSRDQKRKQKLATKKRASDHQVVTPYEGGKYRKEKWTDLVFRTEYGVLQSLVISQHRLTNQQTKAAFARLVLELRAGEPPVSTAVAEQEDIYVGGAEEDLVIQSIRRQWTLYFEDHGEVAIEDLIGVLRTLLYSIEAHAWNSGPKRGYLTFLEDFMSRMGVRLKLEIAPEDRQADEPLAIPSYMLPAIAADEEKRHVTEPSQETPSRLAYTPPAAGA